MNRIPIDQRLAAPPQENFTQIQGDHRWEFQSAVALNLRELGGDVPGSRRREEEDWAWCGAVRLPTNGTAGVSPASSRGVSPRVGTGGETPPELAGETPAVPRTRPARSLRPTQARESHAAPFLGAWILLTSAVTGLRAFAAMAAAGLLVVTLTGCLSRPPLARETFALTLPAAPNSTNASGTAVLLLRSVVVAPMFDGKALVYRLGEHAWEQDPYAEFLVPPAAMLAGPLRTALRRSGVFRDVIEPGSALTPDRVAEIQVTEFYGDFRKKSEPAAVLALRCTIFDTGSKQPVRLQKEYARRLALPERTAAGVVAGWNEALGQILRELVADLQGRRD